MKFVNIIIMLSLLIVCVNANDYNKSFNDTEILNFYCDDSIKIINTYNVSLFTEKNNCYLLKNNIYECKCNKNTTLFFSPKNETEYRFYGEYLINNTKRIFDTKINIKKNVILKEKNIIDKQKLINFILIFFSLFVIILLFLLKIIYKMFNSDINIDEELVNENNNLLNDNELEKILK